MFASGSALSTRCTCILFCSFANLLFKFTFIVLLSVSAIASIVVGFLLDMYCTVPSFLKNVISFSCVSATYPAFGAVSVIFKFIYPVPGISIFIFPFSSDIYPCNGDDTCFPAIVVLVTNISYIAPNNGSPVKSSLTSISRKNVSSFSAAFPTVTFVVVLFINSVDTL